MSNFIWKYKKLDDTDINKISDEFKLPHSIATIMSLKKINTKPVTYNKSLHARIWYHISLYSYTHVQYLS